MWTYLVKLIEENHRCQFVKRTFSKEKKNTQSKLIPQLIKLYLRKSNIKFSKEKQNPQSKIIPQLNSS